MLTTLAASSSCWTWAWSFLGFEAQANNKQSIIRKPKPNKKTRETTTTTTRTTTRARARMKTRTTTTTTRGTTTTTTPTTTTTTTRDSWIQEPLRADWTVWRPVWLVLLPHDLRIENCIHDTISKSDKEGTIEMYVFKVCGRLTCTWGLLYVWTIFFFHFFNHRVCPIPRYIRHNTVSYKKIM